MRIVIPFFVLFIALSAGGIGVLNALSEPSDSTLEQDLVSVRAQISEAQKEDQGLNGGLIKSLVQTRLSTLRATEAMLHQKQTSLIRFIDLQYTIDGKMALPANPDVLSQLDAETVRARRELELALTESSKYSGGLLKVLADARAATERLKISMLEMRYLTAKWAIPLYELDSLELPNDPMLNTPGNVVDDEGAL